jgi:hypothetical protein
MICDWKANAQLVREKMKVFKPGLTTAMAPSVITAIRQA